MRKKLVLPLLALALLALCCAAASASEARDITGECTIKVDLCETTYYSLRDRDINTASVAGKQIDPIVNITVGETPCVAAYVMFGYNTMPIEAQVKRDGKWVKIGENTQDAFAQSYITFDPVQPGEKMRLVFKTDGRYRTLSVRELYLFSEGEKSELVHEWQPSVEKADLMLLVAHPDDEILWFGGLLPYYAGEKGLDVVVSYLTCSNSGRRIELLNGIWHCGVRTYPDVGAYEDKKPEKMGNMYYEWGGRSSVVRDLVRRIRRFRPEVVVTHAADGEYGHPAHKVSADALPEAVRLAADPTYDAQSLAEFGAWEVKKLYLHKGKDNVVTMDWRRPLAFFDGKCGFEVAQEAYMFYVSQPHKPGHFEVADEAAPHNSFIFTLAYSTVGEDVLGGDLFENVREDTRMDAVAQ